MYLFWQKNRGSHSLIVSLESDITDIAFLLSPLNSAGFNCISLYLLSGGNFCLVVGEIVPGLKSSPELEIPL